MSHEQEAGIYAAGLHPRLPVHSLMAWGNAFVAVNTARAPGGEICRSSWGQIRAS